LHKEELKKMTVMKKEKFSIIRLLKENSAWFVQNVDAIKGGVSTTLGLLAAARPDSPLLQLLFGAGTGVVSFLACSYIEYAIKKYAVK
jgi:hypothetical protein